jgi:hypothetical protein
MPSVVTRKSFLELRLLSIIAPVTAEFTAIATDKPSRLLI